MRKIFTILFAALMSVGMFAKVTPKGTDVWDDATKTLTVNGNPVSNAYIGVSDIENLVISDAVTSIGDNAFEDCNGLKSVAFGSSLASIGKEAFSSCIKLESVTFPASLQSIGKKAFSQCYALTSVTITNGLTSIEQQAFYNCEKLASVTIPNSVASIGMNAFGNCDGLTEIVVAAENPNYSSADGVLFNKDKTTLIQCPGGKQGDYTVPNSVTSIGDNAFASCYLLTSVEIPNSVGEIGTQAFSSCIELTSVTIGNGIAKIGGYAFYYSSKLASVTINATTPPTLGGSAFDKTAAALTIYVPAASVTDYKGAWTAYADKIVAAAEPEPAGEVTVVFAANNKTVERTVTLPHTFWCNLGTENGELDLIIQELYALPLGGYCDAWNGPVATGNPAVTAGAGDEDDDFITISEAFEGTATVSGKYNRYTEMDEEEFYYTLTISTKNGAATAISNTAVETKAIKRIVNGQLLIEKNGKTYNVMGAEVK